MAGAAGTSGHPGGHHLATGLQDGPRLQQLPAVPSYKGDWAREGCGQALLRGLPRAILLCLILLLSPQGVLWPPAQGCPQGPAEETAPSPTRRVRCTAAGF